MNESRSDDRFFKKDRSKKFVFKKKLELIEGRNLASIWKCLVQRSIEESMEIATSCKEMLNISIDSLCNDDQNISRSMPDGNIQFVVTFDSIKIFELGKK